MMRLVVLAALALAGCGAAVPRAETAAPGWRRVRIEPSPAPTPAPDPGVSWALPAGWRSGPQDLTSLGEPVQRMTAASFALTQTRPDRDCRPTSARAQMPADGAIVFIVESRESDAGKVAPRPTHFHVPEARNYECLGPGAIITWTERGRVFQANVLLGRKAGAARRHQVEQLLGSLVVQKIPPPPPPTRWRVKCSGSYDSIRVPPGWTARALEHPHTTPRPRLLFRVSNRGDSVYVEVLELRRGATKPTDGILHRGYRFQTRIYARAGATPADLENAQISARSLGVSGVGRG